MPTFFTSHHAAVMCAFHIHDWVTSLWFQMQRGPFLTTHLPLNWLENFQPEQEAELCFTDGLSLSSQLSLQVCVHNILIWWSAQFTKTRVLALTSLVPSLGELSVFFQPNWDRVTNSKLTAVRPCCLPESWLQLKVLTLVVRSRGEETSASAQSAYLHPPKGISG